MSRFRQLHFHTPIKKQQSTKSSVKGQAKVKYNPPNLTPIIEEKTNQKDSSQRKVQNDDFNISPLKKINFDIDEVKNIEPPRYKEVSTL